MKKLVIVDDNIFLQKTILEKLAFFEDVNCKFTANDGKELLQKLEANHNIDLVLMDIEMPEMNGIEATLREIQISTHQNHHAHGF
jgi:CheY-like chemotaxis protein